MTADIPLAIMSSDLPHNDENNYLLAPVRYIHLNPIRAKLNRYKPMSGSWEAAISFIK